MKSVAERIERLRHEIKSIEKYLPHADPQAYYQDKNRIADLQDQISKLKKIMKSE